VPIVIRRPHWAIVSTFVAVLTISGPASGQALRIVTYNTANDLSNTGGDTNTPTTNGPAAGVLKAIGALKDPSGVSHPIDILALQESAFFTGPPGTPNPTASAFAAALNTVFPGGNYVVASLVNGTTTGPNVGNGPNTLVYRSSSVTLLAQQALGTPDGAGIARQIMEYKFQPVLGPTTSQFYLFNDHFKASTGSANEDRRGVEAALITSTVNALPANTPIIFAGDYNPTSNAADQGYQGVVSGTGSNRGIDPLNPTASTTPVWSSSAMKALETESTSSMNFRDDLLLNSPAMVNGAVIHYMPGSLVPFGNTNTHTYQDSITTGNPSTLAGQLNGYSMAQATTVLTQLTQVSDHLPVVADYQFTPVPEPTFILTGVAVVAGVGYVRRWRKPLAA
jgi:endonuclease/exonuclease/phosphatase family metal-dependent hydrolase